MPTSRSMPEREVDPRQTTGEHRAYEGRADPPATAGSESNPSMTAEREEAKERKADASPLTVEGLPGAFARTREIASGRARARSLGLARIPRSCQSSLAGGIIPPRV